MIEMNIQVKGLNQLRSAYERRPEIVKKYINRAIQASIFEIERNATDQNFQFKTPRSFRTGYLQRSFKFGMTFQDFFGSIGPVAQYAAKVHQYNQFMPRIALASQPKIQRFFEEALEVIVDDLSK